MKLSAPLKLLTGFILAAAILAFSGWLVTGPLRSYPAALDTSIRAAMRASQSPMWTTLFLTVTKLGSTLYLTIVGCSAGLAFIALRWFRPLVLLIVAMAGQAGLHHGFKWLFARPRPAALIAYPPAESFSFPSGHAIAGLCLYAILAWIVTARLENPAPKTVIWLSAAVIVLLIALSRIYIGVHYPSDVVPALLAAAIWTTAVCASDERDL